jgi:hypothetical protein
VADERQLQNIDSVPFEKLRDEFRKKIDRIKDRVFQSTPMKMQDGIPLNGAGRREERDRETCQLNLSQGSRHWYECMSTP